MSTTTTALEKLVFNSILELCHDDCEANIEDISIFAKETPKTVVGVIGSLVKKELVVTSTEYRGGIKFVGVMPIINGDVYSYGCDSHDVEEMEELKL